MIVVATSIVAELLDRRVAELLRDEIDLRNAQGLTAFLNMSWK